jgi:CHAD domain-containing protein
MVLMDRCRGLASGAFALELVQTQVAKLVQLQTPVASGEGSEPLHQMRVAMRRLRTTLIQFEPALQLPAAVNDQRLAKWVRRLGMARDLDVLRERLEDGFLPQLPATEVKALRPVLRQLRRERQLAHGHVVEVLQSRSYLEGLAQLQRWLKEPAFTSLGEQPISQWLLEWQGPAVSGLFLHPGWQISKDSVQKNAAETEQLHYLLENLAPLQGAATAPWISRFKQGQELLGEWNDLQVLQSAIHDQVPGRFEDTMPQLEWLLVQHQRHCWLQWRELVDELLPHRQRRRLGLALLAELRPAGPHSWVGAGLRRALAWLG